MVYFHCLPRLFKGTQRLFFFFFGNPLFEGANIAQKILKLELEKGYKFLGNCSPRQRVRGFSADLPIIFRTGCVSYFITKILRLRSPNILV